MSTTSAVSYNRYADKQQLQQQQHYDEQNRVQPTF